MRFFISVITAILFLSIVAVGRNIGQEVKMNKTVDLPEVVVQSHNKEVLHLLCYVRECSTLGTLSDTVTLYREKIVDYMVPGNKVKKFNGWLNPHVLSSRSYYHFTDIAGRDSVSDYYPAHFSWSDWMTIRKNLPLSNGIRRIGQMRDTVMGDYSPVTIWSKNKDNLNVELDFLADSKLRTQFPSLAYFLKDPSMNFYKMSIRYSFDNVDADSIGVYNLRGMSLTVESSGRDNLKRLFSSSSGMSISTKADMYVLDKEYLSVGEAKSRNERKVDWSDVDEYIADLVPEHEPKYIALMDRVSQIDHSRTRLLKQSDFRLVGKYSTHRKKEGVLKGLWNAIRN